MHDVVDRENGRVILSSIAVVINKKTNSHSFSYALKYFDCYIGPRKYGKQNCNDPEFVNKISKMQAKSKKKRYLKKHDGKVEA